MDEFIPVCSPRLEGNEWTYLKECLDTNWISSQGQFVRRFEQEFASFCGTQYGVTTANGTVALHLALEALGIGPGDEVIVPDLTFAATINAVIFTGASPVLVDIDEESWNIDPAKILEKVTKRTKAIIPVHLYGQPCDMRPIMEIAETYKLYVVEDCAEAHGALYNGQKVGSFGEISCFSFYGNKIITTGEGGMCLTKNEGLYERMKCLRDHGMSKDKRYWHEMVGYNYRMTNLQGAIGLAQLERIDHILKQKSKIATYYSNNLVNLPGVKLQSDFADREKVCWLYSILLEENNVGVGRDELIEILKNNNIETRPFFYPLHILPPYQKYAVGNFEITEKISKRGLNLPSSINLTGEEVTRICRILSKIIKLS